MFPARTIGAMAGPALVGWLLGSALGASVGWFVFFFLCLIVCPIALIFDLLDWQRDAAEREEAERNGEQWRNLAKTMNTSRRRSRRTIVNIDARSVHLHGNENGGHAPRQVQEGHKEDHHG